MKIALGQINTTVGAVDGNVEKMIEYAIRAREASADLIVFHELSVPGYPPKELSCRSDFVSANLKALDRLKEECRGIAVVCGFVDREDRKGGARTYNAAALLEEGRIVLRHRKNALSAIAGFDEQACFKPGDGGTVREVRGEPIGVAISEDAWVDKDFWDRGRKRKTLLGKMAREGARVLIVMGSSPFWPGKRGERERVAKAAATRYRLPLVYVNQVGGNDSVLFDGGSFAVSAEGQIAARAKAFEEDLVIVDTCSTMQAEAVADEDVEDIRKALVMGLRDFVRKCGFQKVILGLSGGMDSALTACLAVEALGRGNVLALVMPSMYSSARSLRDAESLAENLGIRHPTLSISRIYDAYIELLRGEFEGRREDSTEENVQARIRGNLLMAFSNKFGHLVLTTGNRSEAMTGYCTLYGDAAGGLGVIADVPKMMVYRLAETYNREREVIPRSIFEKEPSAELKPDQKDADTLPHYPILDPILEAVLDEGKTLDETAGLGYNRETVRDVVQRIYRSEHKRKQSPPALFVSKSALFPGRSRAIASEIGDVLK